MNTNRHEVKWTSFNEKLHQIASATSCPWYDFVSLVDNPFNWFQAAAVVDTGAAPDHHGHR